MGNGYTRSEQPVGRLTRVAQTLIETFEGHPEYKEGDKLMVLLNDGKRGGMGFAGYADDMDVTIDLFEFLERVSGAKGEG